VPHVLPSSPASLLFSVCSWAYLFSFVLVGGLFLWYCCWVFLTYAFSMSISFLSVRFLLILVLLLSMSPRLYHCYHEQKRQLQRKIHNSTQLDVELSWVVSLIRAFSIIMTGQNTRAFLNYQTGPRIYYTIVWSGIHECSVTSVYREILWYNVLGYFMTLMLWPTFSR